MPEITLPKGASKDNKVPAIVTITGSGGQERDEQLFPNSTFQPFRQIADSLARRGIATLRMDDRGIGESKGNHATATSADFAEDIRAGLAFLRGRDEIDGTKLALRKLDADYDVHDRLAAQSFLAKNTAKGQVVTGLLYVDPEAEDLHAHLNTVDAPLNELEADQLCPGSAALEKINASLR